jgi:mannose-1-phosphate guanylyltransferase
MERRSFLHKNQISTDSFLKGIHYTGTQIFSNHNNRRRTMLRESPSSTRCGIVLAAGEGTRLSPLIHRLRGEHLPKQYVNFVGTRSMLEHTFARVETLIAPHRIFTVVSQCHLSHVDAQRQLSSRPKGTVILQPENKETGPGLLLPLLHIDKCHPDAVVAVFPSDHFIIGEDLFMEHVDVACRAVDQDPSQVVLLGMAPDAPETEYGYILPHKGPSPDPRSGIHPVLRFTEKPDPRAAQRIIRQGGLWNTMVVVFRARSLLHLLQKIVPLLYQSFQRARNAIGTPSEADVLAETYQRIEPVNFSRGFLEVLALRYPRRLAVLPVHGVLWSDWGSEHRIMNVLQKTGRLNRASCTARPGSQPSRGQPRVPSFPCGHRGLIRWGGP